MGSGIRCAVRAALRLETASWARTVSHLPAAALMMAMTPAWAQTAPAQEKTLGKITVTDEGDTPIYRRDTTQVTKMPQSLRDIPQSVTVINRAVLDAQAATKLTDALRNVPGITISAGEGGQIGDNVNLRGFSARTDLFMDGFRDRGQYTRDTFFLEAVEVLKGPSSILFGRGSTGGVINQVTKKPTLTSAQQITGSIGTDDYYRVTADVNEKLSDTSAFRVSALAHDAKSTRDEIQSKRYGLSPSLRLGIGTDTEVNMHALVQRSREVPDYGFPVVTFAGQVGKPIDAPAHNFYGFTNDYFDQDVLALHLTIDHRFSDAVLFTNQTQYSKYKTSAAPTPLGGLVNPITGATVSAPAVGTPLTSLWSIRQQRDRVIHDSALYNQTNITVVLPTGSVTQTILTGLELGRDEYENDTFNRFNTTNTPSPLSNVSPVPAVNLGDPTYIGKPPLSATLVRLPTQNTSVDANTIGAYLNDQIDLTKHWKLALGVRWDRFEAKQDQLGTAYTFPATPGASTSTLTLTHLESTNTVWSKRAGLIYQPTDQQSYYASFGTSFNPSAETVTVTAANAPVGPEKNKSYEVGGKWNLINNKLLLTSAVFRVEKTNARTTDIDGVVTLDGDIRVDGVEVGATGQVWKGLEITGGYTYLDGEMISANERTGTAPNFIYAKGKVPQNVPKHSASLWATYRWAHVWELGGGAVASSKRYLNNFQTALIDGYTRLDATAAFIQPRYDLRLNVLNATDRKYFEAASGGRATPVAGRTAIVTGSYRF